MKYTKSPMYKLCFLLLVASKLDGNTNLSWSLILAPFMIEQATEVFVSIVGWIYDVIKSLVTNIKRNQEFNTRYTSGPQLYWDATNKKLYSPFETEEN